MLKDYLGSPIYVGDRGIRVQTQKTYDPLVKFTVSEINEDLSHNQLLILVDGGKKRSRASAEHVLIQTSFSRII